MIIIFNEKEYKIIRAEADLTTTDEIYQYIENLKTDLDVLERKNSLREVDKDFLDEWLSIRGKNGIILADIYANKLDSKIRREIENYVRVKGVPSFFNDEPFEYVKTIKLLRDILIEYFGGTNFDEQTHDIYVIRNIPLKDYTSLEAFERFLNNKSYYGKLHKDKTYKKWKKYVDDELIVFIELLEEKGLPVKYAEENFVNKLCSEFSFNKLDRQEVKKELERLNLDRLLSSKNDDSVTIKNVDSLSGEEFEDFIYKLFIKMGYYVEKTKSTGDQGVDLIVTNQDGSKVAVQCKRYQGNIGNSAIQEVIAGSVFYNTKSTMVVTNSYFTPSAIDLANKSKTTLCDRDRLSELILKYL